ncbi:MAG: helix-turn-helix domain-containing protein [Pirellulaceae bacterium]
MPPLHVAESAAHSAAAAAPSAAESLQSLVGVWAQQRLRAGDAAGKLYDELLAQVEPPLLEAALKRHHGQCAAAARALGMHRTTLKKKLDQYGIEGDD